MEASGLIMCSLLHRYGVVEDQEAIMQGSKWLSTLHARERQGVLWNLRSLCLMKHSRESGPAAPLQPCRYVTRLRQGAFWKHNCTATPVLRQQPSCESVWSIMCTHQRILCALNSGKLVTPEVAAPPARRLLDFGVATFPNSS